MVRGVSKCFLRSDDAGPVEHSVILNKSTLYTSVYIDTEDCIITVLLNFSILCKSGMNIVIYDILLVLFTKILYKQSIINVIQCCMRTYVSVVEI